MLTAVAADGFSVDIHWVACWLLWGVALRMKTPPAYRDQARFKLTPRLLTFFLFPCKRLLSSRRTHPDSYDPDVPYKADRDD